jgi:hypothetical protein
MLDEGQSVDSIVASWQEDLTWFAVIKQKHTLYSA